jgi:hypothetical protein
MPIGRVSNSDDPLSRSRGWTTTRPRSIESKTFTRPVQTHSRINQQTVNPNEHNRTYVIADPCPTTFSFRSVDDLPVLRFVNPSVVLRAVDLTRGRAAGASPNAFSRFGSISTTHGENGFSGSMDGAVDMRLLLWLIEICWRTGRGTGVRCASRLAGCTCGDGWVTILCIGARA